MSWLYYLAEANIYLAVFYLAYCLFLNRDTHYQLGRAFLVFSCVIAFVLPVLQIGALKPVRPIGPVNTVSYSTPATLKPIVVVRPTEAIVEQTPTPSPATISPVKTVAASEHHFSLQEDLWCIYLTGAGILLIMLFIKLFTLFRLTRNEHSIRNGKYRVIYLPGADVAFSFFNYLFIGTDAPGANTIITHELVHIRQKHSADIVFLELLKIINWFNPFIYLLQNSLKTVHEYIADEHTAAFETDTLTYASFLLTNAYGAGGSSITHSFFNYNLLKKRIIMLNQQRSGNSARLKYLVAIPICAGLLCASTLVFSKSYGWVDLAPAKVKTIHPTKRKLLKITQNGITTLSDRLAIDQQNQKVVYTPANITGADKISLAKNHHINVEVVGDSTVYTTKDGRPMLPVINVDGYYQFDHFLHKNVHYDAARGEKGGLVVVEYALDNDRHIINAKIEKSGGAKLDALALNGFNTYKGTVNDDAGKNYKLGVYFFTNDYSIFKTDSMQKVANFAGELIITNYKYPFNVTSKGYEYDESGSGIFNPANARVIIYDKNGEGAWYYKNKCTMADLQMLKDKYGYTFPSATSNAVGLFNKDLKKSRLAYLFNLNSYLSEPYSKAFYNNMIDTLQYPQQAQKALKGGVVVLGFNLGADGMISDVKVAQSAGNGFDKAAVNALQSYRSPIVDDAGRHSIAIVFCVAEKKYRPVVNNDVKREGYVGELAVSDIKSPFKFVNNK